MKVYILLAASNSYKCLEMAGGDLFEFSGQFKGIPLKSLFKGAELRFSPENLPKGDYPSLIPSVPVFSRKAITVLRDLLENSGELFRVLCSKEEYFLFNVTRLTDALDETNSECARFDDGRIFDIERHSFFPEKLPGLIIFKLEQHPLGSVYVTEPFVQRVKSTGLKGFGFQLVWSND